MAYRIFCAWMVSEDEIQVGTDIIVKSEWILKDSEGLETVSETEEKYHSFPWVMLYKI